MSDDYPIMLKLEGKKVVVVGAGTVAERKVFGLLGTGAQIMVISPAATNELKKLADKRKIVWQPKPFSDGDIKDAFMIFAATNDRKINQSVRKAAGNHQLVIIADNLGESDFHVPARFQRGRLSIAVSTGGASPILASKIRTQLEHHFDDSYEDYLEFLFSARQWILKEGMEASCKRSLLTAILSPEFLNSENREESFQRLYEELTRK